MAALLGLYSWGLEVDTSPSDQMPRLSIQSRRTCNWRLYIFHTKSQ